MCQKGFTGLFCENFKCPNDCNAVISFIGYSNGKCVKGECECYEPYIGIDCSVKKCE